MPEVFEKPMSRSGTRFQSARRIFCALGYATPGSAIAAVNAAIVAAGETEWDGLVLRTFSYDEPDPRQYLVTVVYGELQSLVQKPTGSTSYDFQVALETAHVNYSLDTVNSYTASGETASDHKNAIGVQEGGAIEGVDILRPTASFGISIRPENALVTQAYEILAGQLVGSVNNGTFRGRPAGEVLFTGLRGGWRSMNDSELRLEFVERRNQTGIAIGDITGVVKEGWDYLWVERKLMNDPMSSRKVNKAIAAYVERVYQRANLNDLLIGVS